MRGEEFLMHEARNKPPTPKRRITCMHFRGVGGGEGGYIYINLSRII